MNQQVKQDRSTPGQTLRRARTVKQWSVEEVSQRLKLPTTTIRYLEKDDCDFNNIYQRGYALNYAKLLGLNLERFTKTLGDTPQTASPPPSALARPPQTHRAERFLRFATYALGTAVVAVPLVWSLTEGAANFFTRQGFTAGGSNAIQSGGREGENGGRELTASGRSEGGADNETAAPSHVSASVAPLTSISGRTNTLPIQSPLISDNQSALPAAADVAPDNAAEGTGIVQALIDNEQNAAQSVVLTVPADAAADQQRLIQGVPALRLSLQSDSWVEITDASGQRLEYDLLRGGSVHDYQGEAPYRILIGRAIGVKLEHHGERVDLASHIRGNVASFELARSVGAVENTAENTAGEHPDSEQRTP